MKQKLNKAMSDEPKTDAKMLICDNTLFMAIVLCSAFISSCPRDSDLQRSVSLANYLSITPKISFTNKMMTE